MKAAVWRQVKSPLLIEDVELATPQDDELEIEVAACAICHSDLMFIDGGWADTGPTVYGHEVSGRVVRAGPGVDFHIGEPVVATLLRSCQSCHQCSKGRPTNCTGTVHTSTRPLLHGQNGEVIKQGLNMAGFAERIVVHKSQVARVPVTMPWTSAAVISCGVLTGYGSVKRSARINAGDSVAVVGLGGVGLNAIQKAAVDGAGAVYAIDFSKERREAALAFGATHGIDPADAAVKDQLARLTDGHFVDHVIVCVGSERVIDEAIDYTARGGSITLAGMPADGAVCHFDPQWLSGLNKSIHGTKFGQAVVADDVPEIIDLYEAKRYKLDELATHLFAFDDINEALDNARAGHGVRSVLLFDWAA